MAIVMDDFFKVRVDSYGLQNSIIKDLKTLKWLMSCSGMFSLHIGKKPKKGKQSRDGRHFRQTVNQMTGIRDDTCLQKMKKIKKKNWSPLHLAIRVTVINLSTTIQVNSALELLSYPFSIAPFFQLHLGRNVIWIK